MPPSAMRVKLFPLSAHDAATRGWVGVSYTLYHTLRRRGVECREGVEHGTYYVPGWVAAVWAARALFLNFAHFSEERAAVDAAFDALLYDPERGAALATVLQLLGRIERQEQLAPLAALLHRWQAEDSGA
jgi:hypothetical protein